MDGGHGASSSSSHPNTCDDNHLVDDFYFSALYADQEVFRISDEIYAQELQLQEALMSSAILSKVPNGIDQVEMETPVEILTGQSSGSGSFCMICMDVKSNEEKFTNNGCKHSFCTDCIGRYVGTKIQENISMVKCPDMKCKGVLEPQSCRSLIHQQVFERWEDALCESLVLGSQNFYCPFIKDCSTMLLDDGGEVVTASEWPNCRRLFCAQCRVVWHAEIDCSQFQKLSKDWREDVMLMELANQKHWRRIRRCPRCKFYLEKTDGCLHITCRCGFEFCYGCGCNWGGCGGCRANWETEGSFMYGVEAKRVLQQFNFS
ncbi:E3 ubiquitin-protein ligase RSL1 [Argentina anserina]|uniref:E3 ubiquitin-protein ligase RSL1 n=1 Tax=Argentina anserina TaxID=57926 RepID=UPI0021762E48|nr:E3 ubiquitin-protein ligase RSL1 [Potentilla anserina]